MSTHEKSQPPPDDLEMLDYRTAANPFAALGEDPLNPEAAKQHHFHVSDLDKVQRQLKQRHIQMYVYTLSTYGRCTDPE
jgi:amino acid permease